MRHDPDKHHAPRHGCQDLPIRAPRPGARSRPSPPHAPADRRADRRPAPSRLRPCGLASGSTRRTRRRPARSRRRRPPGAPPHRRPGRPPSPMGSRGFAPQQERCEQEAGARADAGADAGHPRPLLNEEVELGELLVHVAGPHGGGERAETRGAPGPTRAGHDRERPIDTCDRRGASAASLRERPLENLRRHRGRREGEPEADGARDHAQGRDDDRERVEQPPLPQPLRRDLSPRPPRCGRGRAGGARPA